MRFAIRGMTTAQLRESFLLDDYFNRERFRTCMWIWIGPSLDRGAAAPAAGVADYPELRADCLYREARAGRVEYWCAGKVRVDAETYALENLDCLYIGRGNHEIVFSSEDATHPAEFYLLSYPAHAEYPTRLSRRADLEPVSLGTTATANVRQIRKHIHLEGVEVASWCWALRRCNREACGTRCRPTHTCDAPKFISTLICQRRIA